MKKNLLFLTFLAGSITAWGQKSLEIVPASASALRAKPTMHQGTPVKTLTCKDTLRYAQTKEQLLGVPSGGFAGTFNLFDIEQAYQDKISQTFLLSGSSLSISQIEIFGRNGYVATTTPVTGTPSVTVRATVYNVNASNVPTTALGDASITFTSTANDYRYITFATPIVVTGNYAVAIDVTNAGGVYTTFINNQALNTYDELLSHVSSTGFPASNGSFVSISAATGGTYDFEPILAPIVSYTINTTATATPDPSCIGTPVAFAGSATPADILGNRMYNYQVFNAYFNLAASDSTHVWDMGSAPYIWNSNHNYTYATAGTHIAEYYTLGGFWNSCFDYKALNVTVNPMDNATFAYPSNTICDGSANVTPTTSVAGTFSSTTGLTFVSTATGEINVAGSDLGTYVVTYTTSGPCPSTSTQTITITAAPEAGFSYSAATYCASSPVQLPTFETGASAGTFSSTTGLTINSATGEINVGTSTPGTYVVTNTIAASGSCPAASATENVTIYAKPTAVVSGGGTICNASGSTGTSTVTITLTGTAPFDFTYTDGTTPETITAHATNTYTITANANGVYTVTSVSDANCSNTGTGTATVSVYTNPTVTLSAFPTVCSSASAVVLNQGLPAGGTYAGTGVTGGSFTPSVAGPVVITYTYTDSHGCSGNATGNITVEAAPTVALTAIAPVCSYVAPFALSGGTPAGGTYSGTGVTGGNFNPATAGVGTHTITYTYTSTTGALCANTATQSIVVKNCAGLEEAELSNSLLVYPNPANQSVTVSFETSQATSADISMISLDGKIVYTKQIAQTNEFNQEINVVDFPTGIYLIQIQTANGSATRRLIVQ